MKMLSVEQKGKKIWTGEYKQYKPVHLLCLG